MCIRLSLCYPTFRELGSKSTEDRNGYWPIGSEVNSGGRRTEWTNNTAKHYLCPSAQNLGGAVVAQCSPDHADVGNDEMGGPHVVGTNRRAHDLCVTARPVFRGWSVLGNNSNFPVKHVTADACAERNALPPPF